MAKTSNILKPFCVAITGGIACGKSTVATLFASLDICIVDADIIAREVCQKGTCTLEKIKEALGPDVLDTDGNLNRAYVRNLVFSDENALKKLNAIVHPAIHQKIIDDINNAKSTYVIAVIPLLFEHHLEGMFDRVLVVDCSEQLQIKRVQSRDGSSETIAKSVMAKQVSRDTRLSLGDDVINTDSTSAFALKQKVLELHSKYCELAAKHK